MNATHPLEETAGDGDTIVLRPTNPILNASALEAVCGQLSRLAGEAGGRKLHLDLGCVEYLAPAGVSMLLDLHCRLRAAGRSLRLGSFDVAHLATLGNLTV